MRGLLRYELNERIATGALAEVLRGIGIERDGTRHELIVKRVIESVSRDPQYVSRFWAEARTASILAHPNIVELLDAGRIEGRLFAAFERVDGVDLASVVARVREGRRRLTIGATLQIACEVLRGLHYVHSRVDENGETLRVVHGQLSPENVLIARTGEVKLADVGLAKATIRGGRIVSGAIQGDPRYMAPEQLAGTRIDSRADVYAAGMLLYTLLAGEHPLGDKPLDGLLKDLIAGRIPPLSNIRPDLPVALPRAVMSALATNRADRFATAQEMQVALLELANTEKIRLEGKRLAEFLATHFSPEEIARSERDSSANADPFKPVILESIGSEDAPVPEDSLVRTPMKSAVFELRSFEAEPRRSNAKTRPRSARPTVIRNDPTRPRRKTTAVRPADDLEPPVWRPPPPPKESRDRTRVGMGAEIDTGLTEREEPSPREETGTRLGPGSKEKTGTKLAPVAEPPISTPSAKAKRASPTSPRGTRTRPKPPEPPPPSAMPRRLPRPVTERRREGPEEKQAVKPLPEPVIARALPPRVMFADDGRATWLLGHEQGISAIAFLPDSRRVVSASSDRTLIVWSLNKRSAERVLTGHREAVTSVAISRDGAFAISGSRDRTVRVWDLSSGVASETLEGHRGWVFCVCLSSDGKRAFSGGIETSLKIWDVAFAKNIGTLDGHEDSVSQVIPFADPRRILTGSRDGTLRVWNVDGRGFRGAERTVETGAGSVRALALSKDGRFAVSAGADPVLRLWDIGRGAELHRFEGHTEPVSSLCFSPDGSRILSGSYDRTMRLWDVSDGKTPVTFEGHQDAVLAVACSPDGEHAVSGGADKRVGLWALPRR